MFERDNSNDEDENELSNAKKAHDPWMRVELKNSPESLLKAALDQ